MGFNSAVSSKGCAVHNPGLIQGNKTSLQFYLTSSDHNLETESPRQIHNAFHSERHFKVIMNETSKRLPNIKSTAVDLRPVSEAACQTKSNTYVHPSFQALSGGTTTALQAAGFPVHAHQFFDHRLFRPAIAFVKKVESPQKGYIPPKTASTAYSSTSDASSASFFQGLGISPRSFHSLQPLNQRKTTKPLAPPVSQPAA
mmetsp:Transcript_43404/g.116160  ORF Transcript_43404/g.116160 Transcript_43404/m.116160 type:complete len:200 (-) Transcript_43404:267-866(-)